MQWLIIRQGGQLLHGHNVATQAISGASVHSNSEHFRFSLSSGTIILVLDSSRSLPFSEHLFHQSCVVPGNISGGPWQVSVLDRVRGLGRCEVTCSVY